MPKCQSTTTYSHLSSVIAVLLFILKPWVGTSLSLSLFSIRNEGQTIGANSDSLSEHAHVLFVTRDRGPGRQSLVEELAKQQHSLSSQECCSRWVHPPPGNVTGFRFFPFRLFGAFLSMYQCANVLVAIYFGGTKRCVSIGHSPSNHPSVTPLPHAFSFPFPFSQPRALSYVHELSSRSLLGYLERNKKVSRIKRPRYHPTEHFLTTFWLMAYQRWAFFIRDFLDQLMSVDPCFFRGDCKGHGSQEGGGPETKMTC